MNEEVNLGQIRLAARHSGEPLSEDHLAYWKEAFWVNPSDARLAYQEGLDARNSGMPCLCGNCGATNIGHKEGLRVQYLQKREKELEREGHSSEAASRIIEGEIARGAALKGEYHDEGKT